MPDAEWDDMATEFSRRMDGLLATARATNAQLERTADALIAAKAPGYKSLAIIRERDRYHEALREVSRALDAPAPLTTIRRLVRDALAPE